MNKYRKWYDQLMARGLAREPLQDKFERHHINPRSLGGSDDPSNIVALTYREHFLAHWLLTKFTAGRPRRKMLHALSMMCMSRDRRIVSGWQYAIGCEAQRNAARGNRSLLGYKHTDEARKKMSDKVRASRADPIALERNLFALRTALADPELRKRRGIAIAKGLAIGKLKTPEHRTRVSNTSKEVWARPGFRERAKKSNAAYWADPTSRAKQSELTKAWWAARRVKSCQSTSQV